MPHLSLCQNRCLLRVSSDDFALPSAVALGLRVVWTSLVAIILGISGLSSSSSPCEQGLSAYLAVSLSLYCLAILLELLLLRASSKGTMIEVEKRSAVSTLLLLHTSNSVAELICSIFGGILLWNRVVYPCASGKLYDANVRTVLLSVVVISQLIDVGLLSCCCCALRSRGSHRAYKSAAENTALPEDWAIQKWLKRQRWAVKLAHCLSCGLTGGSSLFRNSAEGEVEQVARTLTHFFHHSGFLDLTPSDVLAGMLLVRLQQRAALRLAAGEKGIDVEQGGAMEESYKQNPLADPSSSPSRPLSDPIPSPSSPAWKVYDDTAVTSAMPQSAIMMSPSAQKRRLIRRASRREMPSSSEDSPSQRAADEALLADIGHGAWYTWAVYSIFMYLYTFPVSGYCGLLFACLLRCCTSAAYSDESEPEDGEIGRASVSTGAASSTGAGKVNAGFSDSGSLIDKNKDKGAEGCCNWHHAINAGVVQFMLRGIAPKLLFASFKNSVKQSPYTVHDDRSKGWVVISIRGTFSLEDAMVDLLCMPADMEAAGVEWGFDGQGKFAHQGFLEAALIIRREIEERGVLAPFRAELQESASKNGGNGTARRLVVIGHSLGAGVGALLTLLLRAQYSSVRCLGYGMPGSICCERGSKDLADIVTSIVNGKDVVPRLSYHALMLLRREVLDAISRAKVNKARILGTLLDDSNRDLQRDVRDFLYEPGCAPASAFRTMYESFQQEIDDKVEKMPLLFIPGRIVHFVKHSEFNELSGARALGRDSKSTGSTVPADKKARGQYTPLETQWQAYTEIIVSPTMIPDHMPDLYLWNCQPRLC